MSGDGDFSVYGEAKGEYTRQLCVFLVPTLETYMLELLDTAKGEAPTPTKILWQFQVLLQGIPEWNQDKVLRETEKLQKDCACDYLEELITAVFIAHTKVLSAIRLSTKQKKLQITIPKIDHFLHRVLSESARSLWTNAYLFADTSSIEKQKNLRQVSSLLNDSVLQAIRGLLPVKSILREYLHDDDDDKEETATAEPVVEPAPEPIVAPEPAPEPIVAPEPVPEPIVAPEPEPVPVPEPIVAAEPITVHEPIAAPEPITVHEPVAPEPVAVQAPEPIAAPEPVAVQAPVINIETKPRVTFSNSHVMFDSDVLEENGIQDIPFADESLIFEETDENFPMEFDEALE